LLKHVKCPAIKFISLAVEVVQQLQLRQVLAGSVVVVPQY
jgi:hypothetical protein